MPRLTISIPDDLYARLRTANAGPYKLNVSQVCQEAIAKALDNDRSKPAAPTRQVTRTPRSKPAHQGELSEMERLQDIMDRGGFKTSRGGR